MVNTNDYRLQMYNSRAETLAKIKSALDEEMKDLQEEAYQLGRQSRIKYETLVELFQANVDNELLSDAEFRNTCRRLLKV